MVCPSWDNRGRPANRSFGDVAASKSASRCLSIAATVSPNLRFASASLSHISRSSLDSKASSKRDPPSRPSSIVGALPHRRQLADLFGRRRIAPVTQGITLTLSSPNSLGSVYGEQKANTRKSPQVVVGAATRQQWN